MKYFYGKQNSIGNLFDRHEHCDVVPDGMMALAATIVSTLSRNNIYLIIFLQVCNILDEYRTGKLVTVNLARLTVPSQAQIRAGIDLEDRKNVGYLGFYDEMLALLKEMKQDFPDTYSRY